MAGLAVGSARLEAIDGGALRATPGASVKARGFITGPPRRTSGEVRIPIKTAEGRLLVEAREPVGDLPTGAALRASGTIREPDPWERGQLRVRGIAMVLEASEVDVGGGRRGGLVALTDEIRGRAETALERGMGEPEAALARGFVLGEDDLIDRSTTIAFRRSGLAHLLAVSGQNVLLLVLLAAPLLAVLGLSLRARLLATLALIALYVPVAGAGPSIQRAGVMGAAGVVATISGRPPVRWYAVLLAVGATLGMNPRASADVGWQLSFAAVVGILLWSPALRDVILRLLPAPADRPGGGPPRRSGPRVALADGAAMTVAATVSTAPLAAHHFEAVPLAALPANLLALPAVAPVMWLGMLVAIVGQIAAVPVEPVNWLAALLIRYVAEIAELLGEPEWAMPRIGLSSPLVLAGTYLLTLGAGTLLTVRARLARGLSFARGPLARATSPLLSAALIGALIAVLVPLWPPTGKATPAAGGPSLELTVLDVGQGDSILLEPDDGPPVLVDAGAPGAGILEALADGGVDSLGALVLTHDQSDHVGGAEDLLGALPIDTLAHAGVGRGLLARARAAGSRTIRLAAGDRFRSGGLGLETLWPPFARAGHGDRSGDPNEGSVVLLARWRHFSALLTGDAEAEAVILRPPAVDLLKVAHHGSEDAGLGRLLERTSPRLAVISVGDNPYGHPAPATLGTLASQGIPVLRTDLEGDIRIVARAGGWAVAP